MLYALRFLSLKAALWLVFFWFGSWALISIPHGKAEVVTMQHCGAGEWYAKADGVPCKATRQYYGWPVKASVKYVDVQALDGKSFLPKRQYECLDGCGRGSLGTNTLILIAVTLGPYGLLKLWASYKLNKELKFFE